MRRTRKTNASLRAAGVDVKAGRLLLGITRDDLARRCGLPESTVRNAEAGLAGAEVMAAVADALQLDGVLFGKPGDVRHIDGRIAPTRLAVGRFHGDRIRKARWHLVWSLDRLASETGVTPTWLRRLERGRRLNDRPQLALYQVVGALQRAGMVFAPTRHPGRRTDRCLIPRPKIWNESRHRIRVEDYKAGARGGDRRTFLDEFDG